MKHAYRYRDAATGEYVSREYAEANPATTVRERAQLSVQNPAEFEVRDHVHPGGKRLTRHISRRESQ